MCEKSSMKPLVAAESQRVGVVENMKNELWDEVGW